MARYPLTERFVDSATAVNGRETLYWDDAVTGFSLVVYPSGRKAYAFTYRIGGRQRRYTIGDADVWPLKGRDGAREYAKELSRKVDRGEDPVEERRQLKVEGVTFEEAVRDYHRRYQVGEKNNATADEVRDKILRHCAAWCDRPVASIEPAEARKLLENLRDDGRAGAANNLFNLLGTFFNWAAARSIGYIDASPLEGETKPSDHARPPPRPYSPEEIAALWRGADELGPRERAYLRVLLLLGKRKGSLVQMRWDEVGEDGWWRMAGATMPAPGVRKLNMPVPLPAPALRIIRSLSPVDGNPYVFAGANKGRPAARRGRPLYPGKKLQEKISDASGVEDFKFHDVRDTIATRLKTLGVPGNAARRFIDHAQTGDVHETVYTSADELEEATEDAAETWGRYVKLVVSRRVWARVRRHLDAADAPEGDARRRAARDRRREFYVAIRTGGATWGRWLRNATHDEPLPSPIEEDATRPRLKVVGGTHA